MSDHVCPECGGNTIEFRGNGLDTQYKICSRWKEPGHLAAEEIQRALTGIRQQLCCQCGQEEPKPGWYWDVDWKPLPPGQYYEPPESPWLLTEEELLQSTPFESSLKGCRICTKQLNLASARHLVEELVRRNITLSGVDLCLTHDDWEDLKRSVRLP